MLSMSSHTCLPAACAAFGAEQTGEQMDNCIFLPMCGRGDRFKEEAVLNPV